MKLIPLALMGLGVTGLAVVAVFFLFRAWFTDPFPVLGMENNPQQPIAFPHTVHAQEAGIQCEFCHRNVAKGDAATVPAVEQCLFCHEVIDDSQKAEIGKLLALAVSGQPIDWDRVHRLPDHVQFAHEPHIRYFSQEEGVPVGQVCAVCHGDVSAMDQVEQVRGLKMGECIDCHQKKEASVDCTACHY